MTDLTDNAVVSFRFHRNYFWGDLVPETLGEKVGPSMSVPCRGDKNETMIIKYGVRRLNAAFMGPGHGMGAHKADTFPSSPGNPSDDIPLHAPHVGHDGPRPGALLEKMEDFP